MKKTLSLILALLMSVSTAVASFAAEEPALDADVEVAAGAYDDAISYLGYLGIYKGVTADNLAADQLVNRNQMARFAARIATGWVDNEDWENGPLNTSKFTDLADNEAADYYGAISYAAEMGIIEGYGDGTYGPMDYITYQNALTIVARTLGYKNLAWPWGYIQKAVELGLTEGIEGVAYTQDLTRGEVAQIIYNALFAETKDGTTLALKSFNKEFAWEDVVITVSDRDAFLTADSSKCAAGFVGFQIVEDGELSEDIYYAKASAFDLAGHDDDLAVGASYKVFFEKNADSELVDIIDYKTNYVDSAWNFGNDFEPEIEALFDNEYKLVTKYAGNYVGGAWNSREEMIVFDTLGGIVVVEYTGESKYGVDMNTGDIVKFEYDKNGEPVKNEDGEFVFTIEWYYNALLDAYYDIVYDDKKDEIGVRYMDAKAEAALLEAVKDSMKKEVAKAGFAAAAEEIDEDSAYASLDIYNVDGKAYGLYEEYKFGYFSVGNTIKCCDAWRQSYKVESLALYTDAKEVDTVTHETFHVIAEGACKHGTAWINPYFADNKVVAEDGTVSYANGYVIYSADAQTGEVKILKYINDCEDEDTYVDYGTVTGFSVADEYVVINGEKMTFNYDNLEGAAIINVIDKDKTTANKAQYSDNLRLFFNQYVQYVVVDGEIVYMAVSGASNNNLFVVEKYAGITSDGFIAVSGYWTDAPTTLTTIRVESYNNNFNGSMFYYADAAKAAAAFHKGAVYAVSSKTPAEIGEGEYTYNMQIVGKATANGYTVNTASKWVSDGSAFTLSAADCKDGYITINGETKRNVERTFILVGDPIGNDNAAYCPIATFSGKIADPSWTIAGTLIKKSGETYVVVNANWIGFSRDKVASSVVALLGDYFWTADYENALESKDWYLLGAAEFEVEVFDFYTASATTVSTYNLGDLEAGYVYKTIDGEIVYETTYDANALVALLKEVYADNAYGSADYHIGNVSVSLATYDDLEKNISKDLSTWMGLSKQYEDLVEDINAVKFIKTNANGTIASIKSFNKDALKALVAEEEVDDITLNGFYIFDNTDAVVYIFDEADFAFDNTVEGEKVPSNNILPDTKYPGEAWIDAESVIDYKEDETGITSAELKSVTLFIDGPLADEDTHQSAEKKALYFGLAGMCDYEDWNCKFTVDGGVATPVYGTIVEEVYEGHDNEDGCNMIKAVTIDLTDKDGKGIKLTKDVATYITITFTNNFGFPATFVIGAGYEDAIGVYADLSKVQTSTYIDFGTVAVEKN